jgi:glycosyltransferase involved in cell wall biosynthesis
MRIAIDAGALGKNGKNRFGTSIFSDNVIRALLQHAQGYTMRLYAMEKLPSLPRSHTLFEADVASPTIGWMQTYVQLRELMDPSDAFLALNQAYPWLYQGRIVGLSHGLSFIKYPHLYSDQGRLKGQIARLAKRAHCIFVTSDRVKREFRHFYPQARVRVLPVGIPHDMQKPKVMPRKNAFLFVGMNHPIKQVDVLVKAFQDFVRTKTGAGWELWLAGDHHPYQSRGVRVFATPSRDTLRELYAQARAYICISHYESLHFPYLEALGQGCPIVGTRQSMIDELVPFALKRVDRVEDVSQLLQSVARRRRIPRVSLQ